jgi:hypothetical protein
MAEAITLRFHPKSILHFNKTAVSRVLRRRPPHRLAREMSHKWAFFGRAAKRGYYCA